MPQHFVILTEQRSGSTMLVHQLREHPKVQCFGELLRKTPRWMMLKGYKGQLRILNDLDPKWKKDRYRFANAEAFRDVAYATQPGSDHYGFKLHFGQHDEYIKRAVQRPEEKLILLRRENLLAQFSSEQIARATGQGNANTSQGVEIKKAKVKFKASEFDKHVKLSNKRWDTVRANIQAAGTDSVYVSYLNLTAGDGMQRILDYLGLEHVQGLESNTIKRNSSRIVDRFTNPDEVLSYLEKNNVTQWASEGVGELVNALPSEAKR